MSAIGSTPGLGGLFRIFSRLGDGILWYVLIAVLPLAGTQGRTASIQMAVAALAGIVLYRLLKTRCVRERPFRSHPQVTRTGIPLDRYSFPSGHTLHAVALTAIACHHLPGLAPALIPVALMIGMSRVVLGLHYPSDVAAGALLGLGIAQVTLVAGS